MTKKAAIWPSNAPFLCEKATSARFEALSISSTHMNATMALRRVMNPIVPIAKRIADRTM